MAERSPTRPPDGLSGLPRVDAPPAVSVDALPDAGLASRAARLAPGALSRLWSDVHLRWALAFVLLALVLRVTWVATIDPDPLDGRFDDTEFYDASAKALAEGKGYVNFEQEPTARWPIGYSGLVASLYVVFGHNVLAPKALNVFLGAATVFAVYVLAARLFDRRAGVVAAALLALFPSQIFFSTLVMTEVLFAALLTLVLLLVIFWTLGNERPPAYKVLLLGLLLGYGAITRGEGGMLVLAVLLIWWLTRVAWRPFLARSAILLAGVVLVITPWTIRNFIVFDAPVLVSTAMGSALWQGNRADAYKPHDFGYDTKFYDQYAYVPYPRKEVEMNNAAMREALDFIVHNPGTEVRLLFKKLYHLYREDAIGLFWIDGTGGKASIPDSLQTKLETVADAYYFVVLGWALVAAPLWFSFRNRARFLLPLTVLVLTATHLVFIPNPRYHFAFIPLFCVLAAQGLVTLRERLKREPAIPIQRPSGHGS